MSGLFAGDVPKSFLDLADRAGYEARGVGAASANLAETWGKLSQNMRHALRSVRGVRPRVAADIADEVGRKYAKVADALRALESELNELGELAMEHRDTFRGTDVDERAAARSPFRI